MRTTVSSAVLPIYRYLLVIGLFFLSTAFKKEDTGIRAVYDLIERVTPGYGKQFVSSRFLRVRTDRMCTKSVEKKERLSFAETILFLWLQRTTSI